MFDSFDHYRRFGDPEFEYGIALAKTTGRVTLRFADAQVLPFQFGNFADNVKLYLDQVTGLVDQMREETERENQLMRAVYYSLAADPTRTYIPPQPEDPVPHVGFAPLRNAVDGLQQAATDYDNALANKMRQGVSPADASLVNRMLISTERMMTREEGLPRRPWFKHQVYAPGFYTGYGVKTLPGVREAIEERSWDEAEQQVLLAAATLDRVTEVLVGATAILSR